MQRSQVFGKLETTSYRTPAEFFFCLHSLPFLCFIPYTNVNLSPSSSVTDVIVNLASLPWQEYGRSMGCSGNPNENPERSIFWNMINAVEKTLFFSGAVGPQSQRAMQWRGSCHAKQSFLLTDAFPLELFHHFISTSNYMHGMIQTEV